LDISNRNPWIPATLLAVLAVAGTAEAKTTAQLASAPGVTTSKEGADPASLLPVDAAKAPIEARLQWASACGEVAPGQSLSYAATLDVDASGAVTTVTRGEGSVTPEVATCLDGVLKEVRFAPLTAPDATVKVAVALALVGTADEVAAAAAPVVAPAVEAAPTAAAPAAAAEAAPAAAPVATADASKSASEAKSEEEDTKPWRVRASLNLAAGSGLFVLAGENPAQLNAGVANNTEGDGTAREFSYSMSIGGSYKLSDLLSASVTFNADQGLTATNQGTTPARTLFFRETVLGLSTTNLWKEEEYTGIGVDVSGRVFLPTDVAAIAANRVMGLGAGLNVRRAFDDVGPGSLSLSYGFSVRANLGGAQRDANPTRPLRSYKIDAASIAAFSAPDAADVLYGDSVGGLNTMVSIANRISVAYTFLDDFSLGLDFGISNAFQRDGATAENANIRSSSFSVPGGGQTDVAQTSLYAGYQLNDYVGFSAGVSTATDPFIHNETGSGYAVRFPFYDFSEPENNLSSVFLTADFSY
jgi:hypothetical protein